MLAPLPSSHLPPVSLPQPELRNCQPTNTRTASQIHNRLNEITFNANLLRELRAIAFVSRLIEEGKLSTEDYKRVNMHRIDGTGVLDAYEASSRLRAEWRFFLRLRDAGRETARAWLGRHYDQVGERCTLDMAAALG